MKKLFGNRFAIIVIISVVFTMAMAIGAAILTKNNEISFADSGYIISSNKVLEFASGTTYKINLNEQVVFENEKGNISSVDLTSIIHYTSGDIALLKNGAFVDLSTINQDIVPFYNITKKSILTYSNNGYTVDNKGNNIFFKNILLRVSDNKFLVTGENVRISIPGVNNTINGKYFEVTFIADGIVLIENENDSYQVTAEGSKIYVDDNIIIDLSSQNISYDGKVALNMSQITIDGNENISIYPEEESENKNENEGNGSQSTESQSKETKESKITESEETKDQESQKEVNESQIVDSNSSETQKESSDESTEEKKSKKSEDVSVDLVTIDVKSNVFEASFQVNNYDKLKENLTVTLKNMSTNEEIEKQYELQDKGLLYVSNSNLKDNFYLNGDTSYYIQVKDENAVYYQRIFTTKEYGFSLEKVLIGQNEVEYKGVFDENTEITSATIVLKNTNGEQIGDEIIVTPSQNDIIFNSSNYNLNSNTEYTISVIRYQINGTSFAKDTGYLNKSIKTLKKAPSVEHTNVSTTDNNEFILNLTNYQNPDGAEVKFYYHICEDTDTFCENPIKILTGNSSTYTLKIGENGIESNKNYRYKAILEYNDNEKVREIITEHSDKFISEGASITYIANEEKTTFNKITGQIKISDPDITIPMPDREDCTGENSFRIHYVVNGIDKYKDITFTKVANSDNDFISNEFSLTGLSANTEYSLELLGNVIKNGTTFTNSSIGNRLTVETEEIQTLKVVVNNKEASTTTNPIKINLSLLSNSNDDEFINQVKTMKIALYYVNSTNQQVQIGDIVTLDNDDIVNDFYKKNVVLDNTTFGIEDIEDLAEIAKNSNGRLANNYVIKFYDAYDVELEEIATENANNISIENNTINYQIDSYFLLNYYASKLQDATQITVQEVKNSDSKNPILEEDTIVGFTVNSKVNFENVLNDYFNLNDGSIYYTFKIYKLNLTKLAAASGNYQTKIANISNYDLIKEYTSLKTSSVTFYTEDIEDNEMSVEGLARGETYIFTFQINTSNGNKYPQEEIIASDAKNVTNASCSNSICSPAKQNPVINIALAETGDNFISYLYKIISDVDNSFANYNLSLINKTDGSIINSQTMTSSDDYKLITFTNADFDFTEPLEYTFNYYTKNTRNSDGYSAISDFDTFNSYGYKELTGTFDLVYEEKGNALQIVLNDTNLVSKTDLYQVVIKENNNANGVEKEFLFTSSNINTCSDNKSCLVIDYSKLKSLLGLDATVSVTSYYETGKSGLLLDTNKYVFKNSANTYLNISAGKQVTKNSSLPGGIYNYSIEDYNSVNITNLIRGTDWNSNLSDSLISFSLNYQKNGASFGDNGIYYPLEIKDLNLTSSDSFFYFSSIIPGITVNQKTKIDEIDVTVQLSGMTTEMVNSELKSDDKNIYIDVFSDAECTNKVKTISKAINTSTPSTALTFEITDLNPDTTYYYQVYANLLNKSSAASEDVFEKTLLYDKGTTQVSDRSATTLNAEGIMGTIKATYKTTGYNNRKINVVNTLKSTDNFSVKYQIYKDSTSNLILPEKTISSPASSNTLTFSNNDVENILYGDAGLTGYKIKITAIYANGNKTLELYNGNFSPYLEGTDQNQTLELRLPTLKVNSLTANKGSNSYNVSFTTSITDLDYVIKDSGTYYVRLYDPSDSSVKGYTPNSYTMDSDGFVAVQGTNKTLSYSGLKANTTYVVSMKATSVRNNVSLSADKRLGEEVVYNNAIMTGNEYDVDLGTADNTSVTISGKNVVLEYSDAVKLNNISKISATILNGSNTQTISNITSSSAGSNWFTLYNNTKWKLQIPTTNIISSDTDEIIVIIKYFAKDFSGSEQSLGTLTYSNIN